MSESFVSKIFVPTGRKTIPCLERILNCCGLFEGKSPHPNPLPEGKGVDLFATLQSSHATK